MGFGSGGHNKKHGTVEDYYFHHGRIDSFGLYNHLMFDKYLFYHESVRYPGSHGPIIYYPQTKTAAIEIDGWQEELALSRVANIDGITKRMYFHCPECGKRVRYLYKKNGWYFCRKCCGLNYKSQQCSGMERLYIKMKYVVEKKLRYDDWWRINPGYEVYELQYIPKPKGMRWEKYHQYMKEYNQLAEDYAEAFTQGAKRLLERFGADFND